jgi:RecA/RadA recombinase
MKDLANELSWHIIGEEVQPNQHAELTIYVPNAESEPVLTNAMYFAGTLESHRITTEDGNELVGSKMHRVLSLTDRGVLAWSMLRDLRLGGVLVKTVGQQVAGESEKVFQWSLPIDSEKLPLEKASTASFFGAMCGIETRDRSLYLLVTNPSQIKMVRQWAKEMTGDDSADPFAKDVAEFSRFAGMARIQEGRWSDLALEAVKLVPGIIRTSSINAQAHWCAGLTLTRGVWTQYDLEVELESVDVAKTLHMVLENLGVRAIIYSSLDTFSREKFKVALRDRLAQQTAQQLLWQGYDFSPDWKGESVLDQAETHEFLSQTLIRAREALQEEGLEHVAENIDVEDIDKDNLGEVAELIFPLSLKKKTFDRLYQTLHLMASPCTYLDRVTLSKATGVEVPMADFSVPIGSLYSTGGLVSHNSTLAMHLANQELTDNSSSVVVFQDYEHSMAVNYARQMGLHRHNGRFLLIPSDEFEMADSMVKLFEEQKVFPALWIIDSVPAMVPKAAFEREADENPQVALQARMLSDLLARWVKFAAKYGTTFLLLNQLRSNIQTGFAQPRGKKTVGIPGSDRENQPGGFALRFYCVPGNTRLLTSSGLIPIRSLPSIEKHDWTLKIGTEWGEGGFQGAVQTGVKSLWRISTHNKREFYASKDHQWKVLTKDCRVVFKRTEEVIPEEDHLLSVVGDCGLLPEDRGLSEDIWFAVGAAYGDGALSSERQVRFDSPAFEYETVLRCSKAVQEVGGTGNITSQITEQRQDFRVEIFDHTEMFRTSTTIRTIADLFPEYGVKGSWRKHGVPELLWTQGKRQMAAFLRGWFSTDGGCYISGKCRNVCAFSKYRKLVQDVQELLLVVGIKSRPTASVARGLRGIRRGYYLMVQGTESKKRFAEIVGFEVGEKSDTLGRAVSLQKENGREMFGIPYATQLIRRVFPRRGQGGGGQSPPEKAIRGLKLGRGFSTLTDSMVHRVMEVAEQRGDSLEDVQFLRDYICNDWWFDKVERVQETNRMALCYDVVGSETETYLINGAVTHNSSMTIDLRPSKIIKSQVFNPMLGDREDIPIANMVRMTVSKNKCGSPYRSAMAYIQFGEGIDTVRTIIDLAIAQKLITVEKGKAKHEIKLPNGQVFSVVGKEKLVQALKGQTHGHQGLEVLAALQRMLQWDKADEVHAQVLGMTEEVLDTGEWEEITDATEVVSEGLLELVLSRETLIEQADTLNMLTRKGKTIYWTNPETGIEYRGQRLELLEGKLGEDGYAAMEKIITAKVNEIESQLNAQEAAVQVSGTGTGTGTGGEVVGVPVEPSVEPILEVSGNGLAGDTEAPEGITDNPDDLLSSVFGEDNLESEEENDACS